MNFKTVNANGCVHATTSFSFACNLQTFCPCTYFTTEMCAVALTVSAAPKGSVRKNTATEVRAKVESETLRKDSYWQEGQYIGRMV